ncbi:MAG: MBOAT family protein [Candidatus Delongbacteria bacterium]|nr:MBOAT family protein [Candidatus Delongbacteria bacterium]
MPLIIFKYYDFFITSINDTGNLFGVVLNLKTLKLFLPIGISFYTFLSLSYIIDVYKKQIKFESNFINHSLSLCYFPIILSGPIHRPRYLLQQLKSDTKFNYSLVTEGLRQVLWGLFTKVVVADSLAKYVDKTFIEYDSLSGMTLLLGSIYFSFQLYFDFNGYSNMAIGVSKMLGINIERNFNYPYLSRTIADFWKRWHISLTKWFRDYIFLPISFSFSRKFKQGSFLNSDIVIYSVGILITWTLTGLWHGANWTFIVWGMIHAIFLILNKGFRKKKKKILKKLGIKYKNKVLIIFESLITFFIVNFAWIYFRSDSVNTSNIIIRKIFDISLWNSIQISIYPILLIAVLVLVERIQKNKEFVLDIARNNVVFRWFSYIVLTFMVIYFSGNGQTFIYLGF